ncbi:MAG: hypothetical protein WDW38_009696 [Sanguina aurantia]
MCKMTEAVTALTAIRLPSPHLRAQISLMRAPQHVLLQASSLTGPLPPEQYTLFISDFTTLLTALVPQLKRMTARLNAEASCSKAVETIFWELWRLLVVACTAFESNTDHAKGLPPLDRQPLFTSLYPAFHAVLAWLLDCSRSPAWLAMRPEHGLAARSSELLMVLSQPTNCLLNLSMLGTPAVETHLSFLPQSFIPLLCCIVTEQYSSTPRIVPLVAQVTGGLGATTYAQSLVTFLPIFSAPLHFFLCNLTQAIGNIGASDPTSCFTGLFSALRDPAVIQLLKAIMLKPERYLRGTPPDTLFERTILALHDHLFHSLKRGERRSDAPVNRDPQGLPLHLNALACLEALETDVWVLHALSKLSIADVQTAEVLYGLQSMILKFWIQAGPRCRDVPPAALATMGSSIVGIAVRCSADGLLLMQEQRDKGQRGIQAGGGSQQHHHHQEQQQQQHHHQEQRASDAAESKDAGLQSFRLGGMQIARGLLTHVSMFSVDTPEGVAHPRPGPGFAALDAWRVTGGWAAVMEALQRGQHHASDEEEVGAAALNSLASLALLRHADRAVALQGSISLAATLRKLMWPYMKWQGRVEGAVVVPGSPMQTFERRLGFQQQRESYMSMQAPSVMTALLDAVQGMDAYLCSGSSCSTSSSKPAGCVGPASNADADPSSVGACEPQRPEGLGSGRNPSSSSPTEVPGVERGAADPPLLSLHIHQLQAITMASLVQLCLWSMDSMHNMHTPILTVVLPPSIWQ